MKLLKWLFGGRKPALTTHAVKSSLVCIYRGKIYDVESRYNKLLSRNVEIVSTTITQDYTAYGQTETFVLVVTYKPN
jgi:hypothetical protein